MSIYRCVISVSVHYVQCRFLGVDTFQVKFMVARGDFTWIMSINLSKDVCVATVMLYFIPNSLDK